MRIRSIVALVALVMSVATTVAPTHATGARSPAAMADPPAVWIGSPVNGRWAANRYVNGAWECTASTAYPSDVCSLPYAHHAYNYGDPYPGDWAVDLQGVTTSTPVKVFAAPNNTSLAITAKVDRVTFACARRSGESDASLLSRGGRAVVVGFYHGTTKVGTAKYIHVNTVAGITTGATISRWNTVIGYPGSYTSNSCWRGVHVHFEMTSWVHYACYNKGYYPKPGALTSSPSTLRESNFVGFIGGNYASGPRRMCP